MSINGIDSSRIEAMVAQLRNAGARAAGPVTAPSEAGEAAQAGAAGRVAHIPIEQAMRQLAGKLPARAGAAGRWRDEFLDEPTGSSSGRAPRGGNE